MASAYSTYACPLCGHPHADGRECPEFEGRVREIADERIAAAREPVWHTSEEVRAMYESDAAQRARDEALSEVANYMSREGYPGHAAQIHLMRGSLKSAPAQPVHAAQEEPGYAFGLEKPTWQVIADLRTENEGLRAKLIAALDDATAQKVALADEIEKKTALRAKLAEAEGALDEIALDVGTEDRRRCNGWDSSWELMSCVAKVIRRTGRLGGSKDGK